MVGQRLRASLGGPPLDDPTVFVEGPITAYSNGQVTINVDNFGGVAGSVYTSWNLSASVNLSGSSFNASMRFSPANCAGRTRTPVTLTINIPGDPATGVFVIYLSPTQTAALTLGDYTFKVLFTPSASSDKFLVLSGTITVIDE